MSAAHYDADGRLTNDSLHSYTWSSLFSGPVAIGTNSMTYDAFNRVVEQQNGSAYVEYLYSPFGYRLATMNGQTYASARIPLPAGSAAVYYGANLPHYYNHADWLGSIRVTSTNLRVVSQDESFAPFGEEYAFNSGNSQAGDVFTGQRRNYVNSGLWDFPLREYFGSQGRWMSPDPAGLAAADPTDPQTWNRYAYVGGNPLSHVDPLGLRIDDEYGHWNRVDAISAQGTDCALTYSCTTYLDQYGMQVDNSFAQQLLSMEAASMPVFGSNGAEYAQGVGNSWVHVYSDGSIVELSASDVSELGLTDTSELAVLAQASNSNYKIIPDDVRVYFHRSPTRKEWWAAVKDCLIGGPDPLPKTVKLPRERPTDTHEAPEGPSPGANAAASAAGEWASFADCVQKEAGDYWWPDK